MLFSQVISDNKSFLRVYKRGQSIVSSSLVVYALPNQRPYNRIGISASKKIGCAVQRNRARRVIREAYRATEKLFPIGYDLVFVARAKTIRVKAHGVAAAMKREIIPNIKQK